MTSQLTAHSHLNPSRFPPVESYPPYNCCCQWSCCAVSSRVSTATSAVAAVVPPKLSLTILTCTPKLEGCRRQALKREQLEIYDPEAQLCAALYQILRPWRNCVVSVGSVLSHGSGHPVAFHQGLAQNDLSPRRFLSSFFIPQVHHPTHKTSKMVRIQPFSTGITKEN